MELKYLLKMNNKTKQELADAIGVTTNTLRNYEKQKNEPLFKTVIKMAEFLNCSLETLAGIKENIIDLKMLNSEKKKLVNEILNMESEDVSKVLSFIAGINSTK